LFHNDDSQQTGSDHERKHKPENKMAQNSGDLQEKIESGKEAVAKHGLRYDAEWLKIVSSNPLLEGAAAVKEAPKNVFEMRQSAEAMLGFLFRSTPTPQGVEETKTEFESPDGTHKFTVSRFATAEHRAPPKEGEPLRPAILVSKRVARRHGPQPARAPSFLTSESFCRPSTGEATYPAL
jgi:hypothetical protein